MKRSRTAFVALATAAVLALALASGCTTSTTVTATSGPLPGTVTALGVGTGTAAPDKASIVFGSSATAKLAKDAMDACSKTTVRIVAALKKAGVDEKEIQSQQISVYPNFDNRGRAAGFRATQSVNVTTKKLDTLGDVISAATAAGATEVNGPQFSMSSDNSARAAAISKAMEDARSRATAMAKASGRTLGEVVSVAEVPVTGGALPIYGAASAERALGAALPTPVLPGQGEQTAQISVVFRLK